ncbi:MAG: hypothetical protein ACC645_02615, partial [Pirellulales bacterium]
MSLVEVAISTLLVGLVVVASMESVGAAFRTWRVVAQQSDAPFLAQQLMTEVLRAEYEEPDENPPVFGPETSETGGTRALFDDVDDYDNWKLRVGYFRRKLGLLT